jgi:hypothetical protein
LLLGRKFNLMGWSVPATGKLACCLPSALTETTPVYVWDHAALKAQSTLVNFNFQTRAEKPQVEMIRLHGRLSQAQELLYHLQVVGC